MQNLGILVIDMQPTFIEKIDFYKKDSLINKQLALIDFAEDNNIPLFVLEYIVSLETIEKLKEPLINAGSFFIDKYNDNAFIIIENPKGEEGHKYISNLDPIILRKYFSGKFCYEKDVKESELESILKEKRIKNLILTGVHKDACVLATAKEAKKRGYNLIIAKDLMDEDEGYADDWYQKNTTYLNSIHQIYNLIQSPTFINN